MSLDYLRIYPMDDIELYNLFKPIKRLTLVEIIYELDNGPAIIIVLLAYSHY
jgi:hypothetical protein